MRRSRPCLLSDDKATERGKRSRAEFMPGSGAAPHVPVADDTTITPFGNDPHVAVGKHAPWLCGRERFLHGLRKVASWLPVLKSGVGVCFCV